MTASVIPARVSLVLIPEVMVSALTGLFDVLNCFTTLGTFDDAVPDQPPFQVEIVGAGRSPVNTASGVPMAPTRTFDDVPATDIVIVPSLLVDRGEWVRGRYPEVVGWLGAMHEGGALLCSACSGVLLVAETGLLDGHDATVHWAYARTFTQNFPDVRLRLERVLVASGDREQFVMSGASASWHDLVLYLVARTVGPAAAQAIAKFLLLQWHADGQAPYAVFQPHMEHGDAEVLEAQRWLAEHYPVASPVEQLVRRSHLPERSFKRRFKQATGLAPVRYVQQLRVREAQRQLERTDEPVEKISWNVGYEDPAFFRRLFKRVAGIPPAAYRRKFRIPEI